MWPEFDLQVEIARLTAADARAALPCQPDVLTLANAFRDAHVQRALLHRRPSIRADLGVLQRNRPALAGVGVFQVDKDLRVGVLAARAEGAAGRAGEAAARSAAPEQGLVEVAEVFLRGAGEFAAVELESLVPIGWRTKILARLPVCAELVVGRPLFRILKDFVRFAELLEARLRIRVLADVRVILEGVLGLGPLVLVLRVATLVYHHIVIILVAHGIYLVA